MLKAGMCGGCNSLRNYHYLSHQHWRRNSWHVDLMPYRNVYVKDLVNHKSLVKCSYHHTENVSTSEQTKINRQFYNSYHTSCVTSTNKTTTAGTSFDSSLQNSGQIKQCLTKLGLPITEGYTCFVTSCPRNVRRRVKLKELDKLYINMTTGFFVCHTCKQSGSWPALKDNIQYVLDTVVQKKRRPERCFTHRSIDEVTRKQQTLHELLESGHPIGCLSEDQWKSLALQLNIEELTSTALTAYGVKLTSDMNGLILPTFNIGGAPLGVKIHTVATTETPVGQTYKCSSRTIPRTDYNGLFGLHKVKASQTEVVLTGTEWDAVCVYQVTGQPAMSLPKGYSTLPQEVLPLLEQFSKITLWLGGDMRSWAAARMFAKKLGEKRCHLVRPDKTTPSAQEVLRQGLSMKKVIESAKPLLHRSIVTFTNLRQDLFQEISEAEQMAGVKWSRYPQMNKLLKGHRRGELTVFTGPTGTGKTTFMSDYSLDLAMQGVNTLWGSFEINNVRLLRTMTTQFAQKNLSRHLGEFDYWADKFQLLPIYFMTFHGQETTNKVIETMSHAVYVHDIAHVIVDNLQFMMGSDSATSADRFLKQDQIISAFRKFATNLNCHVSLIVHPRKERDGENLTTSSIFGSAKVSQEADNVLILQDNSGMSPRGRKFIQVTKNRYDGELGVMLLKFDKESLSFSVKSGKGKDGKSGKTKRDSGKTNTDGAERSSEKTENDHVGDGDMGSTATEDGGDQPNEDDSGDSGSTSHGDSGSTSHEHSNDKLTPDDMQILNRLGLLEPGEEDT